MGELHTSTRIEVLVSSLTFIAFTFSGSVSPLPFTLKRLYQFSHLALTICCWLI